MLFFFHLRLFMFKIDAKKVFKVLFRYHGKIFFTIHVPMNNFLEFENAQYFFTGLFFLLN